MVVTTPENLLGSSLKGKRGSAYKRYNKLEDDRSSWRSQWIEITDYLLPRRGRYLVESQGTKGRKRNSKIVDNTAGQALRTLSAGMMSGLTSPARPWFRLMTADQDVMDMPGVKEYLGKSEMIIRRILAASNFYNSASTLYHELGAFGTAPLLKRAHPNLLLHYRNFTAGEYVIAENEYGQVDTLGRDFTLTVSQVVEQFLWDKARQKMDWHKGSKQIKKLWDDGNYDEQIEIIHMIQPRRDEDRDLTRRDGTERPYADLYFEKGADDDVLLREGGYNRFPAYVPRWDVLGGDIYGYSPGMEHLGDIKQLQHEQKRKAQALDKMVNPPMTATMSLKGKHMSTVPGGTTYVDPMQGAAGFQPAYQIQPRVGELVQDIQEVQERIQRGFYADLFAMMINSDRRQMTATEVAERHEEKLVLLGPVLQRLSSEFLDPLIEDAFLAAHEAGLLPDPPEALVNEDGGEEISIKYVSLLAQAQEAVAAASMERTLSFAGNLSAVAPDVMDNLDMDEAIREYAEILGTSPNIVRDESEVDDIRQGRAQKMKAEQDAMMAESVANTVATGAQGAKVLSEADTQSPNALTDLLGGGGV